MLLRSAAMNERPFSHAQITAACLESVRISRSQVSVGVDTNSRAKRAQTLSLPISDSGSDYGDLSCRHSESSFWLVGKSNSYRWKRCFAFHKECHDTENAASRPRFGSSDSRNRNHD